MLSDYIAGLLYDKTRLQSSGSTFGCRGIHVRSSGGRFCSHRMRVQSSGSPYFNRILHSQNSGAPSGGKEISPYDQYNKEDGAFSVLIIP